MIRIKRNLAVAALVFGLTLCGANLAFCAQPGNAQNWQGWNNGVQLTPEQMAEAQRILQQNYAGLEVTRQALAAKRAELDALLNSPAPDTGRIEELSREIGELRGKMLAARVNARNQLASEGLPPDCFGPCANGQWGYGDYRGGWHHHGGYYGGGHHGYGRRGCPGMW